MTSPSEDRQLVLDLQVPATITGMDVVHMALAGCWSSLAGVRELPQRWRDKFSLAVAEVAANIIQHAHAPDPPLGEFTLLLEHAPDHLTARFVDGGIVATPPESPVMPSVTVAVEDLGVRGRGLALVQRVADRFHYQRTAISAPPAGTMFGSSPNASPDEWCGNPCQCGNRPDLVIAHHRSVLPTRQKDLERQTRPRASERDATPGATESFRAWPC